MKKMNHEDLIRELMGTCYRSWHSPEAQLDLDFRPRLSKINRPEDFPRYPAPPRLDFSGRNPIINERFIAGVDPRYKETLFWEKATLAHGMGYMPSYHIFRETEKGKEMSDIFRKGTASTRMILCGVMPDELQTPKNEQKHIDLGTNSNAYALTTVEWSLYDDDPAYYSVPVLFRYLDSLRHYHQSGKNVYPYLIGANEFELEACAFFLKEMGFQVIFYDATGLVRCSRWKALEHRIGWLERHFKQVVVSNYCSFNDRFGNVSFMTSNWFKVPRRTGQLIRGTVGTKDDLAEQWQLSLDALMYRSFTNIKRSFANMKSQKLLSDFMLEEAVERNMVNGYVVKRR